MEAFLLLSAFIAKKHESVFVKRLFKREGGQCIRWKEVYIYTIKSYRNFAFTASASASPISGLVQYFFVWLGVSVYIWSLYVAWVFLFVYASGCCPMRVAGVMCVCDRRGCNIWIIHCWSKELKRKVIELLNHYCSLSTVTALSIPHALYQQKPCLCFLSVQIHFIKKLSQ